MNLLNEVNIQLWEIKGSNKRGAGWVFPKPVLNIVQQ